MVKGFDKRGAEHSICAHGVEVRGAGKREVPVGVERVLYLAATDLSFRAALLEDRGAALQERDVTLAAGERAILETVPAGILESMIDAIRVEEHGRRDFMVAVAAVSAGAGVATVALSGCQEDMSATGIRPPDDAEVSADASDLDGGE
jgi:hypothetical protein